VYISYLGLPGNTCTKKNITAEAASRRLLVLLWSLSNTVISWKSKLKYKRIEYI